MSGRSAVSTARSFRAVQGPAWRTVCLACAVAVLQVGNSSFLRGGNDLAQNERLTLVRGLDHEIAVTKIALPRGARGVNVDEQGSVDRQRAEQELKLNGAAVNPGSPIEITKMTFKSKAIVFELNGGGKNRKKWYQHIEVGMGNTTQPVAPDTTQQLAYGSTITLSLREQPDSLSVERVKQLLNGVLDFERHSPTALYAPTLPPEFKEAIKKHQIVVGMDRDAVLSSRGAPDRRVREVREGVEKEDWIYGLPPHVLYVTFDGDSVTSVTQY